MSRTIQKGAVNQSIELYIIDSTDGTPETGVLWNAAGMDLKYRREGAAVVSVTEATLAALTTAHADGGFLEIGNGWYRFDLPDAAFATGADSVLIFGTVTGMIVMGVGVQLVDYDPMDSTRLGLTALPNAAAEAAGGLYTRGTGAGQINQSANGQGDANVAVMAANVITAAAIAAAALNGKGNWNVGKTGYALTSAEQDAIVDKVWDEVQSGHVTAGTFGLFLDAIVSGRATPAQVNLEVSDVMNTDTVTLPGQAAPPLTPTKEEILAYIYKAFRNRKRQSATLWELFADNETTVDQKATVSDAAGIAIKQEIVSGP